MKPPINLLHLKYFSDAVAYQSISEAAKSNFVTQSAVSQAIIKLEISTGVALLVHNRQKFQVTDEGRIVFEQARHIFNAVHAIADKINHGKETVSGSLKFVSTNSLGMSFIAPSYQRMRQNFPQVGLNYHLGNLNFIRNTLRKGAAEFGIVVDHEDFSQFAKKSLKKGQFHLYYSTNTPLNLIREGILVDYSASMHIEKLCKSLSNPNSIKIQAELAGWEVVARFTELGIGVGFFPDYILDGQRYPTLKVYPLELPRFEYEICAIYNRDEKLSRAACLFLDQFTC